ncbi:unnamed protein product [Heligmosomoides polygyrus]|uniref:Uncharacterized protein n=1 Tax=Heligmosomoides polygyrus TaxID=6339 RepID=A0A183FKS3_HELPZ|nr:unnamed protein product [Heligmosomoides polygyrus]
MRCYGFSSNKRKANIFATMANLPPFQVSLNAAKPMNIRKAKRKQGKKSDKGAESLKTTKRRLSPETLELIRQHVAARASGNYQLTYELAKLCREAIKEDLRERRAQVLAEAAEAGLSIRNARRNFADFKTKMIAL